MDDFRKKEFKVGVFVLGVLACVVAVFVYVGVKKDIFAERIDFVILSSTGENIERGIPVRLSGFKVGQVEEVELASVDSVQIRIRILARYHKWFREDTRIILDQEGVIGNSYLKVVPGSRDTAKLEPGASITLSKIAGVKELLAELDPVLEDLKVIVGNVRNITDQFLDPEGSMQTVLTNMQDITNRIRENEGLLYYMTEDPRPVEKIDTMLTRIDSLMLSMEGLANNATARVADLGPIEEEFLGITKDSRELVQEFKGIREDVSPTLDNIQQISEDIRRTSKDLYRMRQQTEYTIRLGSDLLQDMRQSWIFMDKKGLDPELSYPDP
ncbi:MAG: MlaD family protein [Desulfonatronovibrionaceae bacterium]